ncbi:CBU_0592 family membrane protein [Georgenia yuyongxinii]
MNDLAATAIAVLGWAGALVSLATYIMVTRQRLATDTVRYQVLNMTGAALLGVSALANGALPSAVVNVIWVGIGVVAVLAMKRAFLARRLSAGARRQRELARAGRARLVAGRERWTALARRRGSGHLAHARPGQLRRRPRQPGSSRPAGRRTERTLRRRTTSTVA